jgi:hypothetical protein
LQQLELGWASLPAERQITFRKGANRWQQMRPQEKFRAQAQKQRFQNLPQRQKQIINQRFQEFRHIGAATLTLNSKGFQRLPAKQRKQIRENFENRTEAANQSNINP